MKKTTILSTLILMAVMIGCSNNMGLTGPDSQINNSGNTPSTVNRTLVWQYAELLVNTENGAPLENLVNYTAFDQSVPTSYLITFTGLSNANKWTNGYLPQVKISKDNEVVLELTGMLSINKNTVLQLNNVIANKLGFYIQLMIVDGNGQKQTLSVDESCFLKLTDLRIYTLN